MNTILNFKHKKNAINFTKVIIFYYIKILLKKNAPEPFNNRIYNETPVNNIS